MAELSVLILGCGSIGERHLRCFQQTGRVRVTACDASGPVLENLARTYGVATTQNWEEAHARQKFDAVVICTPAHLHVPQARRAFQLGLHTLIEKPLSHSCEGVEELIRERDRTGRRAAVAYVYHVFPFLREPRAWLERGELGPIRQIVYSGGQHFPKMRPPHVAPYAQTYYRDRKTGGGAIQDALTHVANWVESVVGPTDSVLCDCAHLELPGVTVEDTVHVSARHGGVLVNYSLNQFQAPNEATLQLNAARGSVLIELHRQRWGVHRLEDSGWTWHDTAVPGRDSHFIAQANAFLDLIEGRPASTCSLEAAQQTLRFNLAALASSESGRRERPADFNV